MPPQRRGSASPTVDLRPYREGIKGMLTACPDGLSESVILEIARTRVRLNEVMPTRDQVIGVLRGVGRKRVEIIEHDDGTTTRLTVWGPR